MRAADAAGHEIVGVWHSHTHTDAYPSPTDVRQAVDPAWIYVLVSLRHGEPALRAYRIRDEVITELGVAVA
jgi:proteasome lid subunit RPN8/RPN11